MADLPYDPGSEYAQALVNTAPRRVQVVDTCRHCGVEWQGVVFQEFAAPRDDDHRPGEFGYRTKCCRQWAGNAVDGYGRTTAVEVENAIGRARRRELVPR